MGSFGSLETAARVRDIIQRQAKSTIQTVIDSPSVGRVIDVDLSKLTCMVWFTGDVQPIQVNLFSSLIPGQWARRNALPSDVSTAVAGYGSMVTVQRLNGKLYVINVLNGGQFGYDLETVGLKVTQQIPWDLNENIAGKTYEMFAGLSMDVTTAESPLNRGEAFVFGPFMPDDLTDVTGGDVEMTVRVENYGVQAFRFNLNATDQFTSGAFSASRWYRVLPNSTQSDNAAGLVYDFDLDVCIRKTVYGRNSTFTPNELWIRIVKQTNDFSSMKTNITFRSGIAQRARSVDNRFIREIDRSPRHIVGYLGYHNASAAISDYEVRTGFDTFGRTTVQSMDSGARPYATTAGAGFTNVNNKLRVSPTGSYTHYIVTDMVSTNNDWDVSVDLTLNNYPGTAGQNHTVGVVLRYVDNNNYHVALLNVSSTGLITIGCKKRIAGVVTTTGLGSFGTFSLTDTYRLRGVLLGDTMFVKFWRPALEDEPTAWMQTNTMSSSLTTGDVVGIEITTTSTGTAPVWTFDNFQASYFVKPPVVNQATPWRNGPWRSSVLRAAQDLQRTMTLDGSWQWDGANVKWTGNIYLSGIGKHRNILPQGQTYMPSPATGEVIPVMPNGTTVTVVSGGIPLAAGQSLYCGIAPGQGNDYLAHNLFIVDATGFNEDLNYQLPEWAVFICHRPFAGPALKTGDGQYAGGRTTAAYGEAGSNGLYAALVATINTGPYGDISGPSISFVKTYSWTRVRLEFHTSYFPQTSAVGGIFGVRINGVDYDISRSMPTNGGQVHTQVGGFTYVAGGVVPAGTYTVIGLWKASNATNTISRNNDDEWSLSARELP